MQPWAFQAREFLRKKVIGKEVCFTVDKPKGAQTREYGMMYLGKGEQDLQNFFCKIMVTPQHSGLWVEHECCYSNMSLLALISPKTHQEKISQSPWCQRVSPQCAERAWEETSKELASRTEKRFVLCCLVSVQIMHPLSHPSQLFNMFWSLWCHSGCIVAKSISFVLCMLCVVTLFFILISYSLFRSHFHSTCPISLSSPLIQFSR